MSIQEQEKIIRELRRKVAKPRFAARPKQTTKIDPKELWELAKKAGATIDDDSLLTSATPGT